VEGYTASAAGETQISLNQLHEGCGARIRYKKVCEVHGEVDNDQIVMGYQYAKDQYAVVDPVELDKLRSEADRSIQRRSVRRSGDDRSDLFRGEDVLPGSERPRGREALRAAKSGHV
jgi:hypothetical protein